ncbi:F-box/LRR-repeat protein 14 [Patella vulgata]|uniref:F-box domain-containing protein n=2 Tax=Patella caerulea TaxID=87958 RepID=A0AAN8JFN5_PATCE|nr:F-box/LRR-repeat protein 14 [Patella vulgata]
MEDTKTKSGTHISSLFPEILAMIFQYLDIKDKGRVAQVCVCWKDASYNRMVWRNVEAKLHLRKANPSLFPSLCRRGIKRVQILSLRRSLRDVVFGIPNLESLNLSGCYNVTDASLGYAFTQDISSMTVLNLSLCKQVTDNSLVRIAQYLKNLEVLELGGCCHITNTGLSLIACSLRKLRQLNLRSCRHVSDQGIGHLAGLNQPSSVSEDLEKTGNARLEYLGLQDCQKLTDHALKHVSLGLCHLKTINLSFCGSVTDSGIKFLSKMTNLRELNLRSCDNISDTGLGFLAEGGSTIVALDVSFCDKVGDQGLVFLSQGMFNLRSLSLSACNISDDGVQRLVNSLHELTTLNIGQCGRITDVSLSLIGEKLKQLRSIDLYGCTQITTVGLEKIMKLPGLTTLNLGLWHKR